MKVSETLDKARKLGVLAHHGPNAEYQEVLNQIYESIPLAEAMEAVVEAAQANARTNWVNDNLAFALEHLESLTKKEPGKEQR